MYAFLSPFHEGTQKHFGIGVVCSKVIPAKRCEFFTEFSVVIDFPVEDNYD
jgi:hypothetical protein